MIPFAKLQSDTRNYRKTEMNRIEREELLRRYLEGEMNLQQEHDFFIQIALDKELRHELKAQQTIEKAFRKDGSYDMTGYGSVQTNVAAMLASLPSPASASPALQPLRPSRTGGRGGWILAGTASAILTVGTFLALQLTDGSQAAGPEERQQTERLESVETELHPTETSRHFGTSPQTETSSELQSPIPHDRQQLPQTSPLRSGNGIRPHSGTTANSPPLSVSPPLPTDKTPAEAASLGGETMRAHELIEKTAVDKTTPIGNDTLQTTSPSRHLRSDVRIPTEPNDSINVRAKLKWTLPNE